MPLQRIDVDDNQLVIAWTLEAPPDQVWAALTRTDHVADWLGRVVEGRIAPTRAADSTTGTTPPSFVIDHGDGILCRSSVIECRPPQVLRFTWEFPDEPPSEVGWVIDSATEGTELTLKHLLPTELIGSYRDGWLVHLTYLEAVSLGEPLPATAFWRLHATLATLTAGGGHGRRSHHDGEDD